MEIDPIFGTPTPHNHSVLWNAMIHPLLNMTIYGAIWYQGETLSHRIRYLYRLNERCSYPFVVVHLEYVGIASHYKYCVCISFTHSIFTAKIMVPSNDVYQVLF